MPKRNDKGQYVKGTVGNPHGRAGTPRYDGFQNAALGFGVTPMDKRMSARYVPDALTYLECQRIYRSSDIGARLVDLLPREALQRGYEVQLDGDDDEHDGLREHVTELLDGLGAHEALQTALQWERALGGAALLIGANDGQDFSEPLDLNRVMSLEWVTPLEPTELVAHSAYTDVNHPKYGRTRTYQLTGVTVSMTGDPLARTLPPDRSVIHESRLIIFPGIKVTRDATSNVGATWAGDSIFVRCLRAIADFDQAFASAGIILTEHGLPVFSMKGLASLVNASNLTVVKARLALLFQSVSTARAAVLDTEETYQRQGAPLTGLPEILDRMAMRLAAAAEMPITLLMGREPSGMNATGASDLEGWYRGCEVYQRSRVRPALRRLIDVAMATRGAVPKYSIKFAPLWMPSEKERAEAKALMASADQVYLENAVLSATDVRRARFAGTSYSFETPVSMDGYDEDDALELGELTPDDREALAPLPTTGKPSTGAPVANTALNGVQISSLLGIVQAYVTGTISRQSAKAIILGSFPTVEDAEAESMLGPEDFKPTSPANENAPAAPANSNASATDEPRRAAGGE